MVGPGEVELKQGLPREGQPAVLLFWYMLKCREIDPFVAGIVSIRGMEVSVVARSSRIPSCWFFISKTKLLLR